MTLRYADTLGTKHRNAFRLLTASNAKTVKGEKAGYLSAILYLAPHTLGGGATLCPYSTTACREMCLAGAGMSGLPRQLQAKINRTQMFNDRREAFLGLLRGDLLRLTAIAAKEGLTPTARLNGTSDVLWERMGPVVAFPNLQFYDYTKVPLHLRRQARNYHLTFSVEGAETVAAGLGYLRAGQSVAIVVPAEIKDAMAGSSLTVKGDTFSLVDGDEHDLRFLDAPGSIILLKPKGHVRTSLMRPGFADELRRAA